MKLFRVLALAAVLALSLNPAVQAATTAAPAAKPVAAKPAAGKPVAAKPAAGRPVAAKPVAAAPSYQASHAMTRKVDSFDFLVDYSGSMMMTSSELKATKIDAAKEVLARVNNAIPNLGYMGSMHTFAPTESLVKMAPHNPAAMGKGIAALKNDLPIFGRMTPMGNGIASLAPEYKGMARPAAVILTSDGVSNLGSDPVAEAQMIYQTQPGICFHVISVADTVEGQANLKQIADLNKCSVMVKASDLLASQAAVDKFVADVFYTNGMEEAILLRGVNFAFDSSKLDNKAMGILDEVAAMLHAKPGSQITLQGWTDSIGTDAYNQKLSQRRADSVRDYLVKKGIPASHITTAGMGKSFKYDNKTAEGRYLNRRTELLFN